MSFGALETCALPEFVEREAARKQKGYGAWTVEQLYEGFVSTTPRLGTWLDTTELTPEEEEARRRSTDEPTAKAEPTDAPD